MHYAFDAWMQREFPRVQFERYCDDIVVHCVSERQAGYVRAAIVKRLAEVNLEVHPEKTRLVYCRDGNRKGNYEHERFDFLGFTFRARQAKNQKTGTYFVGFLPDLTATRVSSITARATSRAPVYLAKISVPALIGSPLTPTAVRKTCGAKMLASPAAPMRRAPSTTTMSTSRATLTDPPFA